MFSSGLRQPLRMESFNSQSGHDPQVENQCSRKKRVSFSHQIKRGASSKPLEEPSGLQESPDSAIYFPTRTNPTPLPQPGREELGFVFPDSSLFILKYRYCNHSIYMGTKWYRVLFNFEKLKFPNENLLTYFMI